MQRDIKIEGTVERSSIFFQKQSKVLVLKSFLWNDCQTFISTALVEVMVMIMIYLESRKGKFGLNLPFRTTFYNFQSSPYKKGLSARKTALRRRPLANVVRPSVEWRKRHSIKVTFGEIGQFSLLLWWVQVLLLFPVFSSKKVLKELFLCCQLQLNSFSPRLVLITWKSCLAI